MVKDTIETALQGSALGLMAIKGVVGVAVGRCKGKPCIMVYVASKTPDVLRNIPRAIQGYAVSVKESGEFQALS